jgi:hypothetical protein
MDLLLYYIMCWYIYSKSLKSIKWMKNTQKHLETIVSNHFTT